MAFFFYNLGIYNSQIQCPPPPNKTTQVDPSLARELARQCDDKDETKRLWLMIARNAAGNGTTSHDGKDVVSRVVMVLKECGPEILSIEDVSDSLKLRLIIICESIMRRLLTLLPSTLRYSRRCCHFCKCCCQYSLGNHFTLKVFTFSLVHTRAHVSPISKDPILLKLISSRMKYVMHWHHTLPR